jgi:hypothetical protein
MKKTTKWEIYEKKYYAVYALITSFFGMLVLSAERGKQGEGHPYIQGWRMIILPRHMVILIDLVRLSDFLLHLQVHLFALAGYIYIYIYRPGNETGKRRKASPLCKQNAGPSRLNHHHLWVQFWCDL